MTKTKKGTDAVADEILKDSLSEIEAEESLG